MPATGQDEPPLKRRRGRTPAAAARRSASVLDGPGGGAPVGRAADEPQQRCMGPCPGAAGMEHCVGPCPGEARMEH
eukprot:4609942-Lingulodinium_polyedra.AAC.1